MRKKALGILLLAIMLIQVSLLGFNLSSVFSPQDSSKGDAFSPPSSSLVAGRRLGFWTSEDATLGSSSCPSPQQFFNSYFLSPPYPATTVYTSGMSFPSANCGGTTYSQAQWLNAVATLADRYPNINILFSMFINLSGCSVPSSQQNPPASTGLIATGFKLSRVSPLTKFIINQAAGLLPSTSYALQFLDNHLALIAPITTFTTNSTGGWTGTACLPNTTGAQANQGGYIVVQGTHVGKFTGWTQDQTNDFTNFVNGIKGHSSIYGVQYELEYFGANATIQAKFNSIVSGFGYIPYTLGFSGYPNSAGIVQTSYPIAPAIGYGLYTKCPDPAFNKATVTNIVNNTAPIPFTVINSQCPELRAYVWNDPYYQANYLLANANPSTSTSTSTNTSTTTSTVTIPSMSGIDVSFSSLIPPFNFGLIGQNFRAVGTTVRVQVPRPVEVNTIAFIFSDRAYDTNPTPFTFQEPSGAILASGSIPGTPMSPGLDWYPLQLSNIVTLQPGVTYKVVFSNLPSTDTYGCNICAGISQDFLTETRPIGGYLGQTTWPVFLLGLMNLGQQSQQLANYNYGGYTDLFDSPGYQGKDEVAMRFQASQSEQLISFEANMWSSDGSPNTVIFTLRNDLVTNEYSHPVPLSTAPALATASLTAAQVSQNLTAGNNFAKVNFASRPQLTAGSYYWIVMAASTNVESVAFGRLVNPYREYVLTSPDDFQTKWGVPADGPSDLGFRITTTGESIINTIASSPKFTGVFTAAAQSFTPSTSAQVKGAWIQAGIFGRSLRVSIQSDSGSDSPSGIALAQGIVAVTDANYVDQNSGTPYVGFDSPASLSAGTKYWLVYQILSCLTSCSDPARLPTLVYRNDLANSPYDFGGSAAHFEIQNGGAWTTPGMGDFSMFILALSTGHENDAIWNQPTTTTTTATTATMNTSSSVVTSSSATTTTRTTSTTWTTQTTDSSGERVSTTTSVNSGQAQLPTVAIQSNTIGPVGILVDGKEYPTPVTFVWPLGSNHTVKVASSFVDTPAEKSYFLAWVGDINSTSNTLAFVVGGDMNLNLIFKNEYLVNLVFTDSIGRPVSPQDVQFRGSSGNYNLSTSQLWLYSGRYQVTHATWLGFNVSNPASAVGRFVVNRPGSLPVALAIYDEAVKVSDVYGFPIQGAKVTLVIGERVQEMLTNASGIALFPELPPGPRTGIVQYLTYSTSFDSSDNGTHTVYVTATLSYPLLISILVLMAIAAYITVSKVRRKPEPKKSVYFYF